MTKSRWKCGPSRSSESEAPPHPALCGWPPHNPPMQRTGVADIVSVVRKLLGRGPATNRPHVMPRGHSTLKRRLFQRRGGGVARGLHGDLGSRLASAYTVDSVGYFGIGDGSVINLHSQRGQIMFVRYWSNRALAATRPSFGSYGIQNYHGRLGGILGFFWSEFKGQRWTDDFANRRLVVAAPLWVVALVTAVLPAAALTRLWRSSHRRGAGLCHTCGYDLRRRATDARSAVRRWRAPSQLLLCVTTVAIWVRVTFAMTTRGQPHVRQTCARLWRIHWKVARTPASWF